MSAMTGAPLRVLLVDDSPADLEAHARMLARDPLGAWEVQRAGSVEQALGLLEHGFADVDLVVADMNLPGADGLALVRTLAARPGAPAVMVLTGSVHTEARALEALRAGAQDYLSKEGLSPARLRVSVRGAVERVRLQRAAEERRREAEAAELRAREALAQRDELMAMATHDLKGPLQVVRLQLQLLGRKLDGAHAESLSRIERATGRMDQMVGELLYRTARAGGLARQPVDLAALLRARVTLAADAPPGGHPLRLEVEGGDAGGDWDVAALERVLDNLLGNAEKFSPPGSPVTLRVRGAEDWVEVDVEDVGAGIPEADLARIFEPHQRGSNVRDTEGSGVGLASVRRLVEAHGGSVRVRSRLGQGSTFTVRLPRAQPARPRPQAEGLSAP